MTQEQTAILELDDKILELKQQIKQLEKRYEPMFLQWQRAELHRRKVGEVIYENL